VRPQDDFARLLEAADLVAIELARNLLDEAGIPSLVHGPDFDMAELGVAAHHAVRRRDLYVPRRALARAQAVLERAWGPPHERGGAGA
jgi:hypothetical protein